MFKEPHYISGHSQGMVSLFWFKPYFGLTPLLPAFVGLKVYVISNIHKKLDLEIKIRGSQVPYDQWFVRYYINCCPFCNFSPYFDLKPFLAPPVGLRDIHYMKQP